MPRVFIRTAQIGDGEIIDADINANAAIASTKLAAWSANRDAGGNNLINLAPGVNPNDAVTKSQLDAVSAGLDLKDPVDALAAADVGGTYNATGGTSGRGQFTGMSNAAIDGVALTAGMRILLVGQTNADENGIWVVTTVGTGADGVWDRATDFDSDAEVTSGAFINVLTGGTVYGTTSWMLTTPNPITIGGASGTPLTFVQYNLVSAGNGLTQNGRQFDVNPGDASLIVNATSVRVNPGVGLSVGTSLDVTRVQDTFDIAATQTSVTLSQTPASDTLMDVFVNGLYMRQGAANDWTRTGTTLTFNFNLVAGDVVVVNYLV